MSEVIIDNVITDMKDLAKLAGKNVYIFMLNDFSNVTSLTSMNTMFVASTVKRD